jgi:hypothetical protein
MIFRIVSSVAYGSAISGATAEFFIALSPFAPEVFSGLSCQDPFILTETDTCVTIIARQYRERQLRLWSWGGWLEHTMHDMLPGESKLAPSHAVDPVWEMHDPLYSPRIDPSTLAILKESFISARPYGLESTPY